MSPTENSQERLLRMQAEEFTVVNSPLSQSVSRNGVNARVEIYGNGEGKWILEVVDQANTSHVWDDHFDTDREALAEALRAIDEEPLEFLSPAAN